MFLSDSKKAVDIMHTLYNIYENFPKICQENQLPYKVPTDQTFPDKCTRSRIQLLHNDDVVQDEEGCVAS